MHLLVSYPPKVSVSALVNSLKGTPARRLRPEYTGKANLARVNGHFWSPSCFAASCGGAPLPAIRQVHRAAEAPGLTARPGLTPP